MKKRKKWTGDRVARRVKAMMNHHGRFSVRRARQAYELLEHLEPRSRHYILSRLHRNCSCPRAV